MKKVKMITTLQAYDDITGSRQCSLYESGKEYSVSDSLFNDFIKDGCAELAGFEPEEAKVIAPAETKIKKGKK